MGLVISLIATTLFFAPSSFSFNRLTSFGYAWLLVEPSSLELTIKAFPANLTLELVDRTIYVIVDDLNLQRPKIIAVLSSSVTQSITLLHINYETLTGRRTITHVGTRN